MKKHTLKTIIMLAVTSLVFGDDAHVLQAGTLTVFSTDKTPPFILDSSREWIAIAVIEWDEIERNHEKTNTARRWRLRSRYEHQRSSGPATVQIRIRSNSGISVFTHPWAQSADRTAESYSNWFEDPKRLVDSGSRSIVEAKLIAPPRTALQGALYAVSLEAWDIVLDASGPKRQGLPVNLAYARSLPAIQDERHGPKEALEFALEFVNYCLTGDLASFYRVQAETVHLLGNGRAVKKYRLPPPTGIQGIDSLEEYKRRFDYKLYDAETFGSMFTEWISDSRKWIPGPNSYLFIGNKDVFKESNLDHVDFLVFLIDLDKTGEWKIVARPGE